MNVKLILGYALLFFGLLLLITVNILFAVLFFIAIIVVIIHETKQSKKPKVSSSETSQNYSHLKPSSTLNKKNHSYINQIDTSPIPNKNNYARIIPGPDQTEKPISLDNSPIANQTEQKPLEKNNKEIPAPSDNSQIANQIEQESLEKNNKEIPAPPDNSQIANQIEQKPVEKNNTEIPKKIFNRTFWKFRPNEGIRNKKRKFLKALDLCEQNNIASKAKIRRLRMKLARWNVKNERDVEAMMPDYEHLLDLIEESETRE